LLLRNLSSRPLKIQMSELDREKRPGLAIVLNSITPYHVNLHRLIAAGIPELQLHVLVSHWAADFKWNVPIPPEIKLSRFGAVGESPLENPLRRPIWGWRKGGRFIRYIRDNRVQAVIINGYRFISYLRLMSYCHRHQLPFFVNNDSNIRSEPPLKPHAALAKRMLYSWWLSRASGVFPMGALGDQFFLKYGADPKRLYRVPCWPNFEAYAKVDKDRLERFRQQYRLNSRRRYLVYSGRLVPQKRVDLLIDAFAAIAHERPDWDLLVVGDGVLRDELHDRVPELLRQRVTWTGFLDGDGPPLAYHAGDVLVLPSDHEPWALVIQEAMAAGLVVISSDVAGAAYELIEDKRSGRVFPAGSLEQLKGAILDVTSRDNLNAYKRQSMAALADWTTNVDPVAEIRRALTDVGVLHSTAKPANAVASAI
jgi:glycosyltransferase involved in cell wall biosynthesis